MRCRRLIRFCICLCNMRILCCVWFVYLLIRRNNSINKQAATTRWLDDFCSVWTYHLWVALFSLAQLLQERLELIVHGMYWLRNATHTLLMWVCANVRHLEICVYSRAHLYLEFLPQCHRSCHLSEMTRRVQLKIQVWIVSARTNR